VEKSTYVKWKQSFYLKGGRRGQLMAIDWEDVLKTVGATVGGGAVLLSAAAWLIKALIIDSLARDAKVFETRLKADADLEIERLKNSLQIVAVEHQVRFSKLHEKRAEVIAELYRRLVDTFWDSRQFIFQGYTGQPEQQEQYAAVERKTREFFLFIETNRIYLPDRICTLLDKFVNAVREPVIGVGTYGKIDFPNQQTLEERHKVLIAAFNAFREDIPEARRALEMEFRAILGVAEGG
jgi:hypothetical protein